MKNRALSLFMALCIIGVALVSLTSVVKGADSWRNSSTNVYLTASDYPNPSIPGDWYAPGDTISGRLQAFTHVGDTFDDILDIIVMSEAPGGGCTTPVYANRVGTFDINNVTLNDTTGQATFSFSGSLTQYLSDGTYCVWVEPTLYLENAGVVPPPLNYDVTTFDIHQYWIDAAFDRDAYIPGDTVSITYLVSYVKNNSLVTMPPSAAEWMYTVDGTTFTKTSFTAPSGTLQYTILTTAEINPTRFYPVYIWYNVTPPGLQRSFEWSGDTYVGGIRVSISNPSSGDTYTAGDLLEVDVSVRVTSTWWGSYPYAGAAVTLSVLNGDTGTSPPLTGYSGLAFVSDGLGNVKYMLFLDPAIFISGNKYTVNATAVRILKTDYTWEWFNVRVVPQAIAVRIVFDKQDYYSGDTGTLTVSAQVPEGHSQPNAYKYTMYPSSGNYVFKISSGSQPTFSFTIPLNYDDDYIYFLVEASNAEGDYGSTTGSQFIAYGVMIVNADPDYYNPSDTVTFNAELKSVAITSPGPLTFFYEIQAGMSIVKQGTASASGSAGDYTTSIPFTVPAVAAQSYTIYVMANQNGHIITGSVTVNLKQGYIMSIKFDKDSYNAGDTMKISYTITPIAPNTPSPTVYSFSYGIAGLPFESWSGTSSSGEFTYKVTDNANEGDNLFEVQEYSTGAAAVEVVLIGPEKGTIGGIAVFEWFLLALIVILFLLMLAFRFRGAPSGGAGPKIKEEKAAPPPPPGPSASPMIVNCKACGAPIEITTSKRPIEVMCPSCGETAMVE